MSSRQNRQGFVAEERSFTRPPRLASLNRQHLNVPTSTLALTSALRVGMLNPKCSAGASSACAGTQSGGVSENDYLAQTGTSSRSLAVAPMIRQGGGPPWIFVEGF